MICAVADVILIKTHFPSAVTDYNGMNKPLYAKLLSDGHGFDTNDGRWKQVEGNRWVAPGPEPKGSTLSLGTLKLSMSSKKDEPNSYDFALMGQHAENWGSRVPVHPLKASLDRSTSHPTAEGQIPVQLVEAGYTSHNPTVSVQSLGAQRYLSQTTLQENFRNLFRKAPDHTHLAAVKHIDGE